MKTPIRANQSQLHDAYMALPAERREEALCEGGATSPHSVTRGKACKRGRRARSCHIRGCRPCHIRGCRLCHIRGAVPAISIGLERTDRPVFSC